MPSWLNLKLIDATCIECAEAKNAIEPSFGPTRDATCIECAEATAYNQL